MLVSLIVDLIQNMATSTLFYAQACECCRRYASKVKGLRSIFSEYGLIRFRVAVEARWLQQLSSLPEVHEVESFSEEANQVLEHLATAFNVEDAAAVKKV